MQTVLEIPKDLFEMQGCLLFFCVGVEFLQMLQLSQLSTIHLFRKDNDCSSWRQSYWRCHSGDRDLSIVAQRYLHSWTHGGTLVQACAPPCALSAAYIFHKQAGMDLIINKQMTYLQFSYWYQTALCGLCVYWLVVLFVLFPPAAASLAPTEQLVLTTIRQETSELQDPGPGTITTMRACLTDRFDKSEFARFRLDDALSPPWLCLEP